MKNLFLLTVTSFVLALASQGIIEQNDGLIKSEEPQYVAGVKAIPVAEGSDSEEVYHAPLNEGRYVAGVKEIPIVAEHRDQDLPQNNAGANSAEPKKRLDEEQHSKPEPAVTHFADLSAMPEADQDEAEFKPPFPFVDKDNQPSPTGTAKRESSMLAQAEEVESDSQSLKASVVALAGALLALFF